MVPDHLHRVFASVCLAGLGLCAPGLCGAQWLHPDERPIRPTPLAASLTELRADRLSFISRDDTVAVRARYLIRLRDSARSAGERLAGMVDALDAGLEKTLGDTVTGFQMFADTLFAGGTRPLQSAEQDSVRKVQERFGITVQALRSNHSRMLHSLLSRFRSYLEEVRAMHADCRDCANLNDFQLHLSLFQDDADSLTDAFTDTVEDLRDEFRDALSDSVDTYRSTLQDVRDLFGGDAAEDLSAPEGSALIAGVKYTSHFAYRGRDNAAPTPAVIPSVTYQHASGLSVNLTRYWFANAYIPWGETDLGAEYDFDLTDELSGYIAYTRFWFADSSELSRSMFTNSVFGGITWSNPVSALEVDLDEDFGTRSEFTAVVNLSFPITLKEPASGWGIDVQPGFSATYGQQIFRLVPQVQIDSTGIDTTGSVLEDSKYFGIMDYEVIVPVRLTLGPAALVLSLLYDVPINVIDRSTSSAFFSAVATLSIAIR